MWIEKARLGASKMWLRPEKIELNQPKILLTNKNMDWTRANNMDFIRKKSDLMSKIVDLTWPRKHWSNKNGGMITKHKIYSDHSILHNHERELTNQPKCRTSAMDRGPSWPEKCPMTWPTNGSGWCKDGDNQILSGVSTGMYRSK